MNIRNSSQRLMSLLTDFGTVDHYVGAMKGVILADTPGITLVDLGHQIPPGDVEAAAFALLAAYRHFPRGTVHVAVVDPGVGSERRAIVVKAAGQLFVGPDNGLFSYLLERERDARVFQVVDDRFFRQPLSTTFHGRDLFAPVGAALVRGVPAEGLGPAIHDARRLAPIAPRVTDDGRAVGRILHVDRFGNCITSLTAEHLVSPGLRVFGRAGVVEIAGLRSHYAGAPGGSPFLIEGSSGFIEISVDGAAAATLLGLERGNEVEAAAREVERG